MSRIVNIFYIINTKLNENQFIQAIKQSFTMLLPILFLGSMSLLLQNFPIDSIRNFIETAADGIIYKILTLIYTATFGFSSIYVLVIVTNRYYKVLVNRLNSTLYVIINSIISYLVLICPSVLFNGSSILNYTNMNNVFSALITSLIATNIFHFITEFLVKSNVKITFSSSFNTAMYVVLPILGTLVISLLISIPVYLGTNLNINDFISKLIAYPFEKLGQTYLGGLLITFLSVILFFFGIHGRTVFQDVYLNVFSNSGYIVTNALLESFTLIGGVGSTLSLVIALLLFSKGKRKKKIAKSSIVPMIFNINEFIIYGVPIIFNPIYIIPFVIVPIVNYSIGYLLVATRVLPIINYSFQWTTPFIISGFMGTSSITGAIVQVLCLLIGVFIYIPFVLLDNAVSKKMADKMNEEVKDYYIECENQMVEPKIFGLNNHLSVHAETILLILEENIKNHNIELHYQPQVMDNKIVAVEALLRFKYKESQYLFPPVLIEIAKEKGIYKELSKEIVKRAVYDFKNILKLNKDIQMSVNLNLDILHDKEFLNWLTNYIDDAKIPKYKFGVEVTENSKYKANPDLNKIFDILHFYGINIYMDDFLMGHTSIAFLQNTMFDYVKLDGKLVKNIDNERSENIIASIIELGRTLHFEVVAEFVETKEQQKILESLGCDRYQGYLYYRAMPYYELIKILKNK